MLLFLCRFYGGIDAKLMMQLMYKAVRSIDANNYIVQLMYKELRSIDANIYTVQSCISSASGCCGNYDNMRSALGYNMLAMLC